MKVSKQRKCDCKLVDLLCKHAFWAESLGLRGEVYQDAVERLQSICLAMWRHLCKVLQEQFVASDALELVVGLRV